MKPRGGVRRKIALFISMAILIIAVTGIGLGYFIGLSFLKKDVGDSLEQIADILAQQVNAKISDEISFLRSSVAGASLKSVLNENNSRFRDMSPAETQRFMESMDSRWAAAGRDSVLVSSFVDNPISVELKKKNSVNKYIAESFITDRYGALIAASGKTTDFYQADEDWWQEAFAGGKGGDFLGDVELDESSGSLAMTIALPIREADGSVIGVIKAEMDVREFFSALQKTKIGNTGRIALINGTGYIILNGRTVPLSKKILSNEGVMNEVLRGESRPIIVDSQDEKPVRKFIAFSLIENPVLLAKGITWRVAVSQDTREALAPLYRLFIFAITIAVILSVLTLPFGYLFGRIFISPIERLHHAVEIIGRGNLSYKTNIKTGDEIESLADAFFDMAAAIKEREQKILSAKIYNDGIISSMADALIVINLDFTIRSVNKATLDLLGYSEEALVGKPVNMIFFKEESDEEALNKYFRKIISEGAAYNVGLTFITKQGKPIPINFSGTAMRGDDEKITGIVSLARDMRAIMTIISDLAKTKKYSEERSQYLARMQKAMLHIMEDLKNTKDDLQKSYAKLNAAQSELIQSEKEAALGRFSLGVSHEVKNPLAVILGGVEFLEKKLAGGPEDIKANVSIIKTSALRANNILESILQYVRPSLLDIETVGLNDLVNEVVPLFRLQSSLIKSEIVTELNAENIRVNVDRNRIHQVIFNVVKNAIEAMSGSGIVTIKTETDKGMGVIKISDSGVGMTKEALANVFEPFFTTKRPGKGTGLGLVVAKTIIDNHKGKLLLDSEEGKGTTVKIALPLA